MKTLVVGWFSWEQCGATAGDLMARDVACRWLEQAGHSYDIALAPPFQGGVDWRAVDPKDYSQVVFVCGPFRENELTTEFLHRFAGRRLIGLDLSMLEPLDTWNPFDFLLERDSSTTARPDISFLAQQLRVPMVGVILYRQKDKHRVANDTVNRLVASRDMAAVPIDTQLDTNSTGLRSAAEVESLIARMDLVLTTRLHGMVLALKNGVPALAINSVPAGAKVWRQAETIGWPVVFNTDTLTDEALQEAFDYCLTEEARVRARECSAHAVKKVQGVGDEFLTALTDPPWRNSEGSRSWPVS